MRLDFGLQPLHSGTSEKNRKKPVVAELLLGKVRNEKGTRKQTKRQLWKANSLQCLSSEYDIEIRLHEEESLETLAECRQWLSWRRLSSGSKFQMRGPATENIYSVCVNVVAVLGGGARSIRIGAWVCDHQVSHQSVHPAATEHRLRLQQWLPAYLRDRKNRWRKTRYRLCDVTFKLSVYNCV